MRGTLDCQRFLKTGLLKIVVLTPIILGDVMTFITLLAKPQVRQFALKIYGYKIWNEVPSHVRDLNTSRSFFKRQFKLLLLCTLYDIDYLVKFTTL